MDLTNRVLIISGALLWIFIILVVILLAWGAPDQSIDRLGDLAGYLEDRNNAAAKLIITFGGLIVALLALIVIVLELAPPETGSLRLAKVEAGEARMGTDEIAHRLEAEVGTLPQIDQVEATVVARGQKAEVSLELHVGAEADLAATTDEACRRVRQLIEERIGVALARPPRAQLHYRELRVARPQDAQATAASDAPAAPAPPPPQSHAAAPTGQEQPEPQRADWEAPGPVFDPPAATEPTHETSEKSQEDWPAGA